jgi:uncharacterized protein YbbC (DUF1343 family)
MPTSPPNPLQQWLETAVRRAKAPGASAYVGRHDETLFSGFTGQRQLLPESKPVESDTLYDLASLTKVIATTTAVMRLRDEGALDLDQPVGEVVPVPAFRAFTFRHLLTHTSGLIGYDTWYKEVSSINEILQRLSTLPLASPPGVRRVYSDFGFMLLGKAVELLAGDSLDAYCRKHIFAPMAMFDTTYRPPEDWRNRCAATEQSAWRGRVMVGEVHDEHAYAVGGVSGHAGLFSTVGDVAKFCRALLHGHLLPRKTLDEMATLGQVPSYPWQGLGWKIDPWRESTDGFLPSRAAIGHTGWTGTNLWIDRASGLYAILLSNTCHPSRTQRDNRLLRRVFFTGASSAHRFGAINVHTGLDRVLWDSFESLRGKRVAVLTNLAAVDQLGRPLPEVFALDPSVSIKRYFSPEHGFHGQEEAGRRVKKQSAPAPVISLYGDQKRPTPAQLADIDLLVVDLPDVGARYYTYPATMKACLEACAEARKPVLVLDRPNPLGGVVLEGPVTRQVGSDVCWGPVPIRHGMTLGELALFFKATVFANTKLDVRVSLLDGWTRERWFDECSLPWMPPSPNLPTAETALLYVGMCLFEGVNLNEGRGTDTPFKLIGAPWLDAERAAAAIDPLEAIGCQIEVSDYTPRPIPGKSSHPVYENELCQGISLRVTDPAQIRPFTLAVALLRAIRRNHPDQFAWKPFFDILAGGPWLREKIEAGTPALDLAQMLEPDLKTFDHRRPKLYPTNDQWTAEQMK